MEPRTLYKYRDLTGPYGLANAEDMILRDRMRWQSPSSFNDPFDCAPELDFGTDKKAMNKFVEDAASKFGPGNRSVRRKLSSNIKKRDVSEIRDRLFSYFNNAMKNSSVSCFSLVENSPLMWAHYANSHTGICLAFEEDVEAGFFGLNVQYSDIRETVDLTKFRDDGAATLSKAVLTKSNDWSYENEVRMIEYNRPAGPRCFDASRLKSVTLGLRISPADEAAVLSLIDRRKSSIKVYRAVAQKEAFGLRSIPILL